MSNPIPVGSYTARAVGEVQYGITSKGGDYIRVELLVQGPDGPRKMTRDLLFLETTAQRSVESLRYCGWTGNDLNNVTVGVDGFGDLDVEVTIKHEDFTDKHGETRTVAKIDWINSGAGAKVQTPMGDAQKRSFGARFKALAMSVKPTAGVPAAKPAAPAQRPANGRPPARPAPASDMPPVDWEPGMDG